MFHEATLIIIRSTFQGISVGNRDANVNLPDRGFERSADMCADEPSSSSATAAYCDTSCSLLGPAHDTGMIQV